MVQVAVKVEQVAVQAEVVLAWGVLVCQMEEQTVEGLAAGKLQMCHQRDQKLKGLQPALVKRKGTILFHENT